MARPGTNLGGKKSGRSRKINFFTLNFLALLESMPAPQDFRV